MLVTCLKQHQQTPGPPYLEATTDCSFPRIKSGASLNSPFPSLNRSLTQWLTHSLANVALIRRSRHRDPISCYAYIGPLDHSSSSVNRKNTQSSWNEEEYSVIRFRNVTGCSLNIVFFSQEFSKVCHLSLASTWLLLVVQKLPANRSDCTLALRLELWRSLTAM